MKLSSKKVGELTGKLVSSAKALPEKTTTTGRSIKEEFITGYKQASSVRKVVGENPTQNTQQ